MIIRIILFIIAFFAALFLIGSLVQGFLKKERTISSTLAAGLVTAMAIMQVLGYPLFQLSASFSLLFWLYLVIIGALIIYAIYRLTAKRQFLEYKDSFIGFSRNLKENPLLAGIMFAAVYIW